MKGERERERERGKTHVPFAVNWLPLTRMDTDPQLVWMALTCPSEQEVTVRETLALFWGRLRQEDTHGVTTQWDWALAACRPDVQEILGPLPLCGGRRHVAPDPASVDPFGDPGGLPEATAERTGGTVRPDRDGQSGSEAARVRVEMVVHLMRKELVRRRQTKNHRHEPSEGESALPPCMQRRSGY